MVQILERVQAHYESREMPFGKVYQWHPAAVALECDCGEQVRLDPLPHGLRARARPVLASAVIIARIWRLLSTTAERSRACSSAKGRGSGLTA